MELAASARSMAGWQPNTVPARADLRQSPSGGPCWPKGLIRGLGQRANRGWGQDRVRVGGKHVCRPQRPPETQVAAVVGLVAGGETASGSSPRCSFASYQRSVGPWLPRQHRAWPREVPKKRFRPVETHGSLKLRIANGGSGLRHTERVMTCSSATVRKTLANAPDGEPS